MKNFINSLCFFIITSLSISAQNETGTISYGIKLGGTSSWVSGNSAPEEITSSSSPTSSLKYSYESKVRNYLSLSGGVYAEYTLNKNVDFRIELLYVTKGYKQLETSIELSEREITDSKLPLHYLEIPLIATYTIDINNDKYRPYFLGGLVSSYMLSIPTINVTKTKFDSKGNLVSTKTGDQTAKSNEVERLDLGLALGVGIKLSNDLGIELRYTSGFNTIATSREINNKYLALTLLYRLK